MKPVGSPPVARHFPSNHPTGDRHEWVASQHLGLGPPTWRKLHQIGLAAVGTDEITNQSEAIHALARVAAAPGKCRP
jgi:hypothetical protein